MQLSVRQCSFCCTWNRKPNLKFRIAYSHRHFSTKEFCCLFRWTEKQNVLTILWCSAEKHKRCAFTRLAHLSCVHRINCFSSLQYSCVLHFRRNAIPRIVSLHRRFYGWSISCCAVCRTQPSIDSKVNLLVLLWLEPLLCIRNLTTNFLTIFTFSTDTHTYEYHKFRWFAR